jgi:predicted alpha/beta superfamily hydrolase
LGGLFVASTLVTRPGAFSALAASSPTLYWGDRWVFEQLSTRQELASMDNLLVSL